MQSTEQHKELLGDWIVDPDDEISLNKLGHVWLRFGDEGILTYTILGEEKDQVIILIYETRAGKLITCQPSNPRKEETGFSIQDGKLRLEFKGVYSWFIRLPSETGMFK